MNASSDNDFILVDPVLKGPFAALFTSSQVARCVCVCDVACVSGEYLVKWQGLPYSECTQEDVDLIKHHFPVAVEEYNRRRKTSRLPSKNCKVSK